MKKKIINLLNSLNVKNGDSIMIHGDASFISQYSKNKPIKDLNYFIRYINYLYKFIQFVYFR